MSAKQEIHSLQKKAENLSSLLNFFNQETLVISSGTILGIISDIAKKCDVHRGGRTSVFKDSLLWYVRDMYPLALVQNPGKGGITWNNLQALTLSGEIIFPTWQ